MLLVYALIRLEAPGRGLVSAALSGGAGLVLLAGFVAWERRAPAPLLRPGILSIRSLRGATLGAAANSGSFTAVVFVGTLYLQTGLYATVIALVAGEGAVGPEALARGYGAAFLAAAGLAVLGAAGAWQLHGHPADRGG